MSGDKKTARQLSILNLSEDTVYVGWKPGEFPIELTIEKYPSNGESATVKLTDWEEVAYLVEILQKAVNDIS